MGREMGRRAYADYGRWDGPALRRLMLYGGRSPRGEVRGMSYAAMAERTGVPVREIRRRLREWTGLPY